MNNFTLIAGGAILIWAVFIGSTAAFANNFPVKLEIVSPEPSNQGNAPDDGGIQFRAGWPLTLRLTVEDRDMVGVGTFGGPEFDIYSVFPEINQGGAIVFDDPDGCYSPPANIACGPGPISTVDETLIEFYPDRDLRGVADGFGNFLQRQAAAISVLRPAYGGPSLYGELSGETAPILDSYGWGADDDIPGLVILADVGGSLVLKDSNILPGFEPGDEGFWDPVEPLVTRNSAGFMTMVGYELSTASGKTSITASMLVPRHLYSHTRLIDLCTGDWTIQLPSGELICSGDPIQRIDGGPVTLYDATDRISTDVTLRAFVIANLANEPPAAATYQAINILQDMNDDGEVNSEDAELAGYLVLSNEVELEFTQILNSTGDCNGLDTPGSSLTPNQRGTDLHADLDGNGQTRITLSCPGGGGGVAEPPRR